MALACRFCDRSFSSKSNLTYHESNAKYCIEGRNVPTSEHICEYCSKTLGTKYSLRNHLVRCSVKKEKDARIWKRNLSDKYRKKLKDQQEKHKKEITEKDVKINYLNKKVRVQERGFEIQQEEKDISIEVLKVQITSLREELEKQKGITEGIKQAPAKTVNTAYIHPKLINLPISSVPALTLEYIDKQVNDGILTYDEATRGPAGMADIVCELIEHETEDGEIERNYVCTDVARNSFHRLLESKKWKADKGGRYLNELLDRFSDVMQKYRETAIKNYDETPHESRKWRQIESERRNVLDLYDGILCEEGQEARDDLVNMLRKEIGKRASV